MAVINRMELGRELARTLSQVNQQIEVVKKEAERLGVDPYQLRDVGGNWVLVPLLVSKANLLHGLALVNDRRS